MIRHIVAAAIALLLPAFASPLSPLSTRSNPSCDPNASAEPGPGVEHHQTSKDGGYLWPYQTFKSSPLTPPEWQINKTSDSSLAPGLIFLTIGDITPLVPVTKAPAPYIFTNEGQLVWAGPTVNATNFKWQMLNDKPALTYWSGRTTSGANVGHGYGNITILDEEYNSTVFCPNYGLNTGTEGQFKCQADIHESFLTDRNTILVSAYNASQVDLTSVNGTADGYIWDSQFHEHDPITGELLFSWSSIDHIPVSDSHLPLGDNGNISSPYDYFHINSVVNIGDYYLVNSRHCWTTYLLSKAGEILWRFSGDTGGDFGPLPEDGSFHWEHFVRPHNVTDTTLELSIFNNNNYMPGESNTTDLLVYTLPLYPDPKSNSSQALLKSRITIPGLASQSQGSYFPSGSLPNSSNAFANYGQLPLMKEFASHGSEVWSGRIAPDNLAQIYRGYKEVGWHATPSYPPSLVVEDGYGYVSWNGATGVKEWKIYVDGQYVGSVGYRGFETRFEVPCWAKEVQVGAVVDGCDERRSDVVGV